MDSSTECSMVNGDHPSKEPHKFSTDTHTSPAPGSGASRQVRDFMASKNGGGDPVTALAVRGDPAKSSVAARSAKVQQDTNAALAQFYQSSGSNTPRGA